MALLSKAQIFEQKPLTLDVDVVEWGGTVRIKAPTLRDNMRLMDIYQVREREIEDYEADQRLPEDERKGLTKMERYDDTLLQILVSIVDENNEPMFDPVEDYDRVLGLSMTSVAAIYTHIVTLRTPMKAVESVETLKKTSARTKNGGSSSASRGTSAKR